MPPETQGEMMYVFYLASCSVWTICVAKAPSICEGGQQSMVEGRWEVSSFIHMSEDRPRTSTSHLLLLAQHKREQQLRQALNAELNEVGQALL